MSTPKFERGDVVLVRTPHSDGRRDSYHPALVVGDPIDNVHGDYILVQITSTLYHGKTDLALQEADPDFKQSGLDHSSCIRCHKIFVLTETAVRRKLGSLSAVHLTAVESKIKLALGLA